MKSKSLVSHIRNLALSWTIGAMIFTLTLSGTLIFVMIYKDAQREIQTLAATTLTSYRTDILSGDVRSIELQINKELGIENNERLLFLDKNKDPWVDDLNHKKIEICDNSDGLCKDITNRKVILDLPIYFDSEKTNLWGYIHIEKTPQVNWPLILSVTLAIILGMSFQAFGFYYNLSNTIKSVGETINSWAKKLSVNPKISMNLEPAPFSEMEPIETALAGLRHEIDILEKLAREQGAINTLRGVGHDILNPVSRLKRLLGLIEIKMSVSPHFDQELFLNCTSNLKRLSSYAEQLKVLYKKSSGEEQLGDIPVLDITKEMIQLAKEISSDPEVIDKSIMFESSIAENCYAKVPAPILGRLLENVIGNSIHASHKNSVIKISTLSEGENVVLIIKDQGHGIPESIIDRVFESDFSTKANKGTGLGLFVVKQLCEQYNGNVSVNSIADVGTTVRISFPKVEGAL